MIRNSFKLEKLRISAYKDRKRRPIDYIGTFTAMFNPESFQQKFEVEYGKDQGINSSGRELRYSLSKPQVLMFRLIIDGTGISEGQTRDVAREVEQFLNLTFEINGDIHQPNFLFIGWGNKLCFGGTDPRFACRLSTVEVNYTLFERDGSPLRAELDVVFWADTELEKRLLKEKKRFSDSIRTRTVKSGDTLPLLARQIYGNPLYYLRLARANELDSLRNLDIGTTLRFPRL